MKNYDENMALSMAEYQKHITGRRKWNWTTQETFAAVEAFLCVKDLGTEDAHGLAYKSNQEYANQVNLVPDAVWECGGRTGKAWSIEFRTGSVNGKSAETSVKARFDNVKKKVLNEILPLWRKAVGPDGKIPSGKNKDDIIKLVRDQYFRYRKSTSKIETKRQEASQGPPDGWTNAYFEAFLKYSAPAEKPVETFNPSTRPEKRSATNDGMPGSSQVGRAEHRASVREHKRKERDDKVAISEELENLRRLDKDQAHAVGKAMVQNRLNMTAVRRKEADAKWKEADAKEQEACTNKNKLALEALNARISRAKALWDLHREIRSDAETTERAQLKYLEALGADIEHATPTKSARGGAPSAGDTEDGASSPSAVPGTTEVHVNVDA